VTFGLAAAFKDSNTVGVVCAFIVRAAALCRPAYINDEISACAACIRTSRSTRWVGIFGLGRLLRAVAADKIYVDKASIVGSNRRPWTLRFPGTMEKLGVERRAIAAAKTRNSSTRFSPSIRAQGFCEKMLAEIHEQFITVVRQGRGKRLNENAGALQRPGVGRPEKHRTPVLPMRSAA